MTCRCQRPTSDGRGHGCRVHGRTVFPDLLFLDQVDALAAIAGLALDVIPQDLERAEYSRGQALEGRRHRLPAKFFQRRRS